MTTTVRVVNPSTPPFEAPQKPIATRREYPERDFGIGYGKSSGYASSKRYATAWSGQPRFRCG